jgi:hypothetical protein
MDLAVLTKKYPQFVYKKLKHYFDRPKDLRGYKEYRIFVKKQNELCIEMQNTQNELRETSAQLEELILKKEELCNLKNNQKKEYLDFMNKMSGQDDSSDSEYELEEE